jgi:hypothetical protein
MKKKIYIILGVITLFACSIVAINNLRISKPLFDPDPFNGFSPDLSAGKPDKKMKSENQSYAFFTNTQYEARVGYSKYSNNMSNEWDYYYIAVSKVCSSEEHSDIYYIYFRRWFPKEMISDELWEKEIQEIVQYDESSRIAKFDLGFTNITCNLPPPD